MDTKQIIISPAEDFSAENTFECGQCFRWSRGADGTYTGIVRSAPAHVFVKDGQAVAELPENADESFWHTYFDTERDYDTIAAGFPDDAFTRAAVEYGRGLRVLRQDPWEALCSFIISQCNNIPRIKKIISAFCELFGERIEFKDSEFAAFPEPERVAKLSADELAPIRAGYRAEYIVSAAQTYVSGGIDVKKLREMPISEARRAVMSLQGVGPKVADCFLLYGAGRYDAFPVDTWMKKAAVYYGGKLNAQMFGDHAGIAQQYIFYYARSLGKE